MTIFTTFIRDSAYVPGTGRNISDRVSYKPGKVPVLNYCSDRPDVGPPGQKQIRWFDKLEIPKEWNKTDKTLCMPVKSKGDLSEAMSLAEYSLNRSSAEDILNAFSVYIEELGSEKDSDNFAVMDESEITQCLKDLGFHEIKPARHYHPHVEIHPKKKLF